MIYDLKRSVDLRRLFDPILHSSLDDRVSIADVDGEDRVGNSLLQIWKLRFGYKAKICSDFESKVWLKLSRDFEAEVWSVFCC